MQFLGFWGSAGVSRAGAAVLRFAVLTFLAFAASGHFADAAESAPKFAAITVDARNGKILYANNADSIRHPASLTKMMTLYILFQDLKAGKIRLDGPIRMSARAAAMAPSKLGVKPGATITVETAIKALVVKSANDVAAAVAENLGGTESAFAQRMTRTARSIGMSRTTFANASGLPNPAQVTTARDMATLGLRLMRDFPQYYPYFRIQSFAYGGRTITGHNRLLGRFEGTDGIKTGYIAASGFNLVTSVRRGDKRLVGVVLGGRTGASRDSYMKQMLAQHFDEARSGKMIAAMAGSSKGAVDPTGLDSEPGDANVAEATVPDKTEPAPAVPPAAKPTNRKARAKDKAPQSETRVAASEAAPAEQGDTDEDAAEADMPSAEADLAAMAANSPQQVPAGSNSTVQQAEVVPPPQPQAPRVVQSEIVDPGLPQKLPFQVKSPAEQLADKAAVAALPGTGTDASWMIHIGEFTTKSDAQARIQDLRRKIPAVLDGKTAQTVAVEKKGTVIYRARFTGFDEASATAACREIKKKKAVCQVQAPG